MASASMPSRAPCRVQGCSEDVSNRHHFFCSSHWNMAPEDLQERLALSKLDGPAERDAAIHAISEYFQS